MSLMKLQVYNYLSRNFQGWLDFIFYGISRKRKKFWAEELSKIQNAAELAKLESTILFKLPRTSNFSMRMDHQILIKRRKLIENDEDKIHTSTN